MAYISNQDDEELKKQQAQQAGGFLGNGGVGAGVNGSPKPSTASGSGWTNLRSYLDANKDQAVDLSNKIAGNITKTGDEARNTVQGGVKGYETELSKSNPANVPDLISRASSDPVGFSKSNDVQSFKQLRDGIFGGPSTFETSPGYGGIAAAADKGSKLKTLAETEGGQQELIRGLNSNMGQGKVDLNQLLVSGNPTARTNLVNAAKPYANLRAELDESAGKQNSAREQAIQGTQAASNQLREQFVTPQQQSLKDLQDQINSRVTDSSLDFNKDQVIRDLQAYMGGQETLDPTEKAQFLPEGNFTGYDLPGLRAKVRDSMIAYGFPQSVLSPDYIEKGVSYLLGNNGVGLSEDEGKILNPLRQDVWRYSNDPFEKLRGEGVGNDPNWLQTYFGGTNLSSGNPSAASVASPDEYARIVALQSLLDQPEFLSPDDLALAGTYNPARIGKYQPRIQNNTGTQLPGTPPQQPNPLNPNPDEELWQNGPNRFF